jgi:Skp family chaperone for outer membrane proteins
MICKIITILEFKFVIKKIMNKYFVIILAILFPAVSLFSQRMGFINSQMIRERLPDAKLAEQRCQTMVDEWKRELKSMEEKEESLQFETKKNRLIWSDAEKQKADKELKDWRNKRLAYANEKFSPSENNEYDKIVAEIMRPVEEKIFAAVQEVAAKEKYDFILDQSTQPLAYANFKYDITLKVLKLLGVDVAADEAEQKKKIDSDSRNDEDKKKASQAPRRRSRSSKDESNQREQNSNQNQVLTPEELEQQKQEKK